jgi:hypothetical protein
MTDEPDLVALFYRADWTQLSLSAEVRELSSWRLRSQLHQPVHAPRWLKLNADLPPGYGDPTEHRARLRIAPGGRYVIGILTAWDVANPPEDGSVLRTRYRIGPGRPPYPEVLWPAPLLNAFTLELAERFQTGGRETLRVIATPAPGVWRADEYKRPERIEVIADAATGILLRFEEFLDGQTVRLTELTDVTFDPAGEFLVPDDADDDGADAEGSSELFSGSRWAAAKTAANVFGTVVSAAVRHRAQSPRNAADAWDAAAADDDAEAAMPLAGQRFDPAAAGSPASDELLHALYRSGRAEFTATLHQWMDAAAWGARTQEQADEHGLSGIGSVAGTIGRQVGTVHVVTRVAVGGGRYRLDYLAGRRKHKPRAVACDGSRRWLEYDDRIVVGPVLPLPKKITGMVDTAALLDSHVSSAAETQVNGRRGFALRAAADGPGSRKLPWQLKDADLVVDAELGIVLHLATYADDTQQIREEFRDVGPLSAGGSEFAFNVPPGVRVQHIDDWLFDELGLPEGMRSAARSAGSAAKAAQSLLNSLRGRG